MNKPTFHGYLPLEVVAVDQDEGISLKSQSLFAFTQALEGVPSRPILHAFSYFDTLSGCQARPDLGYMPCSVSSCPICRRDTPCSLALATT
jgi:hypothetical protein